MRTPLTLEFTPDDSSDDLPEEAIPVAVCEPSFKDPGRIFLGVHPFTRRIGLHLLPEEARKIRDHLSKLLMDTEDGSPNKLGEPPEDIQARLDRAVQRIKTEQPKKRKRRRRPVGHFRLEFQVGRVIAVIGTKVDDS